MAPNLSSSDYIELLDSNEVNTYFKEFMIDTAVYSKKNDKNFNKELRELVAENTDVTSNENSVSQGKSSKEITGNSPTLNSKEELLNYSLQSISDYDSEDVPMLKNILNSNKFNNIAKATAMYKLSDIDKSTTDKYLDDIVKNKDKYDTSEKKAAMFILSKYFRTFNDKENYKSLFIKNATDIFKNNQSSNFASSSNTNEDSSKLVDAAVFSLGETKDKDSIRLIANNISSINDNAIVSYFVDMNFLNINQMLEDTNSKDDIKLALSLAEISKYVEFSDNLEKLKNNSDKEIAEKAANILSELDKNRDNPIKRNPKWDNYK